MKKYLVKIIPIILLFVCSLAYGQKKEYVFERITVENGLSQSTVYSILQDNKGFLWFGTQDRGLNKYDGYTFKNYFNNPIDKTSLPTNKISKLIQSKDGIIYIGTWGEGLCILDPALEVFKKFAPNSKNKKSISSYRAQCLYEDKNGFIWIGTFDGGLNRFDPKTEEFIAFRHNPSDSNTISHDRIWDVKEDDRGMLWLATSVGVNMLNPETGKAIRYTHNPNNESSLSHNQARCLYIDNDQTIWVGTALSLDKLDSNLKYFSHFKFPVENIKRNSINRIYQDSHGYLWIGTHIGGLIKFDIETENYIQLRHDPNDDLTIGYNDIRDIYEDHSLNLWIATRGGGVNKLNLNPKPFQSIKNNPKNLNSLSNNRVKSMIEDKDGNFWIGTDVGGGLDFYDRAKNKFQQYYHENGNKNSIASNDISALLEDKNGNIWIGTDGNGISVLDRKTGKFEHFSSNRNSSSLSTNEVWKIYQDKDGIVWVGTNNGLNKFINSKEGFVRYFHVQGDTNSLTDNCVWEIYHDSENYLWIGTDNGLNRYNRELNTFDQFRNNPNDSCSLGFNTVFSIYEDNNNELWIGTANGMNLFNRDMEKFRCFKKEFDLVGNAIFGILEDDNNNLWLSTVNGLSKFNKETFKYRSYDIFDGLQNNDYSKGAYHKTKKGELAFGGVNGVTIFYPDSIIDNDYIPPIVLTDFQIYNKSVEIKDGKNLSKHINYADQIILRPEDDVISFSFAALDFTKPEKNRYKYFLENFDKDWNYVKNRRFASYTNIPAGKYTLHVKASNNDNIWNNEGVSVEVIKNPPFYETIWFYFIEAGLFILIIIVIFRLRVRSLEKDKRILEQNVVDRTREIQLQKKKLEKAYTEVQQSAKSKEVFLANTSHEIRTPLNVIIGYCNLLMNSIVEKKYLDYLKNIRSASNSLLVIINDILDFSKIEAGKLSIEKVEFDIHEFLDNLTSINQIKVSDKNILFEQNISESIPRYVIGDPYRLNQILSNLLDNAIKFTPKRGIIKLVAEIESIFENNCEIKFIVQDTGIGIPEHKINQIFESFTQASPNTTRKFGGTGLGLSIVNSLIDLQNGRIDVESEVEKGSIFTFYLKYRIGEGTTIIKKSDDYKINRAKNIEHIKILLVEDNKVNVTLAIDTIQLYNSKIWIDVAENGKIAVEKAEKNVYDLVIMDVQMPVMDGYEATKYIRNNLSEDKKFIPILGMTAHAMKEEKEKCLSLGMNDYITKPFIPEELFKKIELLLGGRFTRQSESQAKEEELIEIPDNGYIDINTLKKIYGNNKEKISKILELYKSNIPNQLNELKECAKNKNWKNIKVVAHSLKTSFNYLNLEELREMSLEIEIESKDSLNTKTVTDKIEKMLALWREKEKQLDKTIDFMN
jgi:signal transduction histidine kinase/ligand-binding sensor domain-containing protein/DNA-binding response OmpR family regulator